MLNDDQAAASESQVIVDTQASLVEQEPHGEVDEQARVHNLGYKIDENAKKKEIAFDPTASK